MRALCSRRCRIALTALSIVFWPAVDRAAEPGNKASDSDGKAVQLFNGRNFAGWYVYTEQTKHENPDVFQVIDGMIYVPGGKGDIAYYGGLITRQAYSNYHLQLEFKWGEKTYGARKNKARDSGVLVHCFGPNGPRPWMNSYEFQIIEGGTGDLLVVKTSDVDDNGNAVNLACTSGAKKHGDQLFFHSGGEPHTFTGGRLNWWGRDPHWQDVVGYRGREDIESPHGEWTKCEIIARDDKLEYFINGKLANCATGLSVSKGKIFLQTEGAELWYRNVVLTSLEE